MPTAGVAPARRPAGRRPGRATSGRFPRSLRSVRRARCPATPRRHRPDRTSQSCSGPPTPISYRQPERAPISYRHLSAATRPIHQSRQAADDSRGFFHWFALATPLRLVCGHPPSGGANGPLRCQNCSRPRPQSRVRPVLNFSRSLRGPTAEPFHLRTELQRLVAHRRSHRSRSA